MCVNDRPGNMFHQSIGFKYVFGEWAVSRRVIYYLAIFSETRMQFISK